METPILAAGRCSMRSAMKRREFLILGAAAGPLWGQRQSAAPTAGAPVGVPPAAKITSSVVLGRLKGTFEERVLTAAKAGIQSVELGREYAGWDEPAQLKAKRLVGSFGMRIASIAAADDWKAAIAVARKLECPQVILTGGLGGAGEAAAKAEVTLVVAAPLSESLKAVKEADHPYVRLLFDIGGEREKGGDLLAAVKEAVDYTAVFRAPENADKEVYRAIQKAGFSRYISMDYDPVGDPVASLTRAVDGFRAALMDRPLVPSS